MSFVTALLMAYEPAKRLSRMRITIESAMVGVRMISPCSTPETLEEHPEAVDLPKGKGLIELDQVTSGYADGPPVLQDLSLVFEPERPPRSSPLGRGKSTIPHLIMRLYDPTSGTSPLTAPTSAMQLPLAARQHLLRGTGTPSCSRPACWRMSASARPGQRRGGDRGCKAANAHEFHRGARTGLRHAGRREWRLSVRRAEAAACHRPGHPARRADPASGRGDRARSTAAPRPWCKRRSSA